MYPAVAQRVQAAEDPRGGDGTVGWRRTESAEGEP